LLAATLALLAQPAMAQAPETSTKAQPSDPVFPYLLTIQQPAEGATLDVMIMNAAGTYTAVSSGQTVYNGRTYSNGRDYFDDGRYTAGSNGRVYGGDGNAVSRDLTRDARDIVRDTGDAIGDIGRGIGDMITGNDTYSGTPSWEPDSSAVRY